MNTYKIYNLIAQSSIQTSYLPQVDNNNQPQVFIDYGEIPQGIGDENNMRMQVAAQKFTLKVDGIATFYVCDGKRIIVSAQENISEDVIMLFLLSTPWAILLLQRGLLPLDGSAIVDKDKGIAFIGRSAAGKSSMALALQKKNYSIVSDGMCVIDNNSQIMPGTGYLQTWKKTLLRLQIQGEYPKVRSSLEKYYIPLEQQVQKPVSLKSIFILNPANQDKYTCETIRGLQKFTVLQNNVWGQVFVQPLKAHMKNFATLSSLAQKVTLKKIDYPHSFPLLRAADFIEKEFVDE